jgi:hypothetical protein
MRSGSAPEDVEWQVDEARFRQSTYGTDIVRERDRSRPPIALTARLPALARPFTYRARRVTAPLGKPPSRRPSPAVG